ncbi:MAG TPA: hypothetical protein P5293_05705 [Bacteroidales bacterium]|nr:hypothetical protein [Bacteroidales bacterium]
MSNKSPEMEKFLNDLSKMLYGRERHSGACVACGSHKVSAEDFRDALSYTEYGISNLCQECQDKIYKICQE